MKAWRIAFATAGILLGLFGAFRLLTQVEPLNLLVLAGWVIGAVIIHDGILSPAVVGVGWVLARTVPARARRYLQGALIVIGLVTVVAIRLILLRGREPASKAILLRDYGGNLTLLIALAAAASLGLYAMRVARDRVEHRTTETPAHSDE